VKYIINERLFMRRPPEGPLAAHVRPFGIWAFEQGYSRHRVHRRVVLAAGFSEWLLRKRIRVGDVCSGHPAQYLRHRARQKRTDRGDRPALKQFMDFLQHTSHGRSGSRRRCDPSLTSPATVEISRWTWLPLFRRWRAGP